MNGALSGYRVLDLCDEKGMFCSRLLADMGAEVIRVEPPGGGNLPREEAGFCYLNLGKRSVTLDLDSGAGQGIFRKLAARSDAVVESSPPGYLDGLGLGWQELSGINDGLVMTSVTGFGQDGPYRDYKWCDLVASALGGYMYVCGDVDTPPLKPFGNQTYHIAGLFGAIGTLLALRAKNDTGSGQHVDISAMECAAATLDHVLVRYLYEGEVARRQGTLHWNNAFRVFPCRDGYILLSLFHHWDTLVELLAAEGMAEDLAEARFRDGGERLGNIDHVIAVLEKWTAKHTVNELVEQGQLMRFPWAQVASVSDLLRSPQLAGRDYFIDVNCPDKAKTGRCPGSAVRMSGSPWQVGDKAPAPGEHNQGTYRKETGLSREELNTLREQEVI